MMMLEGWVLSFFFLMLEGGRFFGEMGLWFGKVLLLFMVNGGL